MNFFSRLLLILAVMAGAVLIGLQIAAGFFLKPVLEREGKRMFGVPVEMSQAGANILAGSVWMKYVRIGNDPKFGEPDFLHARTVAIDVSMLSLLGNEFGVSRILLKDPILTLEWNQAGESNLFVFADRAAHYFGELSGAIQKLFRWMTRCELEKFTIRRGRVQIVDDRDEDRSWTLGEVSFSLARIVYPPDPEEALPVAAYLSGTIEGESPGQVVLIGRMNPFMPKLSFDMTVSVKDLFLSDYNQYLTGFPLAFSAGTMQAKIKALCHDNQVDLHHQIRFGGVRVHEKKKKEAGESDTVFRFPPKMVAQFFNDLWPAVKPLEFDFHVTGNLEDPDFDSWDKIRSVIEQEIHDRLKQEMDRAAEEVKKKAPAAAPMPKTSGPETAAGPAPAV